MNYIKKGKMKKIFFLVVTFLVGLNVVNALDNTSYVINQYSICDNDNNKYPIYSIWVNGRYAYFLTLSKSYNLNFKEYYPVDFKNSPFSEDIKYYNSAYIYDYLTSPYFISSVHRVIWERLYPDKNFNMCNSLLEREPIYQQIKKKIYDIKNGPNFILNTAIQLPGEVYEYEDENLKKFYVYDSNGLNITLEENKLLISGDEGIYKVRLKRNSIKNQSDPALYTDGINYLLFFDDVIDEEYIFNIEISYPKYELIIKDEENNPLSNKCFNIEDKVYCSNEYGIVSFSSQSSNVCIKFMNDSDLYKDYFSPVDLLSNNEITLLKHEIIIPDDYQEENELTKDDSNISEDIPWIPENDENFEIDTNVQEETKENEINRLPDEEKIEIEVEDTFSISWSLIIMGIYFAFINRK